MMNEILYLLALVPFLLGTVLPDENAESGTETTDEDEGDHWSLPSFGELDDAEEAAKASVTEEDTGAPQSASTTESETTQEESGTPDDGTSSEADPATAQAPEAKDTTTSETSTTSQQDTQTATQETQQQQQTAASPEQEAETPQQSAEERRAEFQRQRQAMETQVAQHYTQMYSSVAQEMGDEYDDAQLFGKLAAKVFSDATIAALQQSQNLVPALIRQETTRMEAQRSKETEFFGAFPELKDRKDLHPQVGKAYQAIKQAYPEATHEQAAEMAGTMVMQQNGLQRQAQPPQNPQQQQAPASQPKQQAFKPAAASPGTPSQGPGNGASENNPWVGISASLWNDDA